MKQILQNARNGKIEVRDVPAPRAAKGCVLVRVVASLVSAGTERASSEFASKNLIQKAQARPDLARDVVHKIHRDGLLSAISAVRSRLDQPSALGYSCAGTVVEVGEGISDIRVGDRVACAGAGFAVHAEFACVPRMLAARIASSGVDFESAAFTTVGAVAMHAVRTAEAKLGEIVAVIGLGLLGQISLQILRAAGCTVIGFDLIQQRAALAVSMGAIAATTSEEEFCDLCLRHSNGYGADSVLITAETPSSAPVNLASQVARDRGIVVAVGAVGMELERRRYYEKELYFRVSRSYGPGRYDASFEQKGIDYPIGHVRWTETRNMEAFLHLLADEKLHVKPLITHRYEIENAASAYELITGQTQQPYLGVLIQYPADQQMESRRLELVGCQAEPSSENRVRVGLLGAGNFARGVLIPAMRRTRTELTGICAANGVSAQSTGKQFGFVFCTTDEEQIYSDDSINAVVIATRHNLHAAQVIRALEHGKHVFCEKPLCLTEEELDAIQTAYASVANCRLMVGFNRRFAPMIQQARTFLAQANGPFTMHYRVNAGPLASDHWVNDPEQGGRILGEMGHFVDLLSFICASSAVSVQAKGIPSPGGQNVTATIEFENGSIGTITYVCSGDRAFSKERIEVFRGGAVAALDDFRRLDLIRHGKKTTFHSRLRQDKGHKSEWLAFANCITSGDPAPIAYEEIVASTRATIRIAESLRSGVEQQIGAKQLSPLPVPLVS